MQLRLRPKSPNSFPLGKYAIKAILLTVLIFTILFFLNKLNIPAPKKMIKQEISNDKLIELK